MVVKVNITTVTQKNNILQSSIALKMRNSILDVGVFLGGEGMAISIYKMFI